MTDSTRVLLGLLVALGGVATPAAEDCNENGIDDTLDIDTGRSRDCDSDGVPDECQAGEPLGFVTFRRFRVGSSPTVGVTGLIAEDFDGDGWMDIVTASTGVPFGPPDEISILPGGPDRTFSTPVNVPLDFRVGYALAAGDFDRDGDLDLAVSIPESLGEMSHRGLSILENRGRFDFFATATHGIGQAYALDVVPADVDGDAVLDLVVVSRGTSQVSVLRGRGDGTFLEPRAVNVGPLANLRYSTAGDLDDDGLPELILTGTTDRWLVGVLHNVGAGQFSEPTLYEAGPVPVSVEIGDIDRDGDPDVVAGSADSVGVGVLFNDGTGHFPDLRILEGAYNPHRIALGDFDGDGWLDVYGWGGALYRGRGGGDFAEPEFFVEGRGLQTTGDFDGDGYCDVALSLVNVHYGDAEIGVLYSRGDGRMTSPRILSTDTVPRRDRLRYPFELDGRDLDDDGDVDLLVICTGGFEDYIALFRNPGDGSFGRPEIQVVEDFGWYDADCLDLDRDGDEDLVACGLLAGTTRGNVRVWLNQGDGTFTEHESVDFSDFTTDQDGVLRAPGTPEFIAAADFDGDADIDLVTVNSRSNDLSVLWNTGDCHFEEMLVIRPTDGQRYHHPKALVAADLDGDSDNDIALLHVPMEGVVSVLRNNGNRDFTRRDVFEFAGSGISLDKGDLTGDGVVDLVAGVDEAWTHQWDSALSSIVVLEGRGDGTFAEIDRALMPRRPASATVSDVDRDGDLDVISTGNARGVQRNTVCIILNDGHGRLGEITELPSELHTTAAVAEDLTGDGKVDLAVLNYNSRSISLYINEAEDGDAPPGPCERDFLRGDLDTDGSVSMWDGVQILWHLFSADTPPGCQDAADADDDGQVRISDAIYLFNFLFRHGPPPPAPFRTCSPDPTQDDLDCVIYSTCP